MDNQNQTTPSENAQNAQTLKAQYNELRQKIIKELIILIHTV